MNVGSINLLNGIIQTFTGFDKRSYEICERVVAELQIWLVKTEENHGMESVSREQ